MTALEHLAFYGALRGDCVAADAARCCVARGVARGVARRRGAPDDRRESVGRTTPETLRRRRARRRSRGGSPGRTVHGDGPGIAARGVARARVGRGGGTRAMVLTTHSTEEADALCRRIAIARKGAFRCLGTTQRLKAAHGEGYALVIRVSEEGDDAARSARRDELRAFVAREMPGRRGGETVDDFDGGDDFFDTLSEPSVSTRSGGVGGARVRRDGGAGRDPRDRRVSAGTDDPRGGVFARRGGGRDGGGRDGSERGRRRRARGAL